MFFAFTLRTLSGRLSQEQFYLDARYLKSTQSVQNSATRFELSHVLSFGNFVSAVSVERAWEDVFPSRVTLPAWSLAARHEARYVLKPGE